MYIQANIPCDDVIHDVAFLFDRVEICDFDGQKTVHRYDDTIEILIFEKIEVTTVNQFLKICGEFGVNIDSTFTSEKDGVFQNFDDSICNYLNTREILVTDIQKLIDGVWGRFVERKVIPLSELKNIIMNGYNT